MNNEKTGDYIFYIILTILISMLVLNIIEKHLYENAEKDKKMNPFYKDKLFLNIKTGKVVLFILLLAVFILLVNPFKVVGSMLNPNIFSIFVDQQHENLINNVKENIGFTNSEVVDLNKPPYKKIVNELDKTFSELILGKSNDAILNRIIEDNDNSEENVLNVLYTFSKINNFNKFSDEPDNLKFALNKELFRSCVPEGTSLSKESFYGKFLANITTNDEMSTYQRFLHYFKNTNTNDDNNINPFNENLKDLIKEAKEAKKAKDAGEINEFDEIMENLHNSLKTNINKFTVKINDEDVLENKMKKLINIEKIVEDKNAKLADFKKIESIDDEIIKNVENGKFELAKQTAVSEDKLIIFNEFIDLHNKIGHWKDTDTNTKIDTYDIYNNVDTYLDALKTIDNGGESIEPSEYDIKAIKKIKKLIDVAVYCEKEVDDGFLIKGMIDTKIGLEYRWLFDSTARNDFFKDLDNLPKNTVFLKDDGKYYDVNGNPLELFHNEYYENYIKNILTNDYTKSLNPSNYDDLKKLKDITIDEDFLYNYKALKGYISDAKISKIDKIIRKYTRLQRYKNSSCLTRPLFTPDKNNLRNVENIITLLTITFGVEFITSIFVLGFDANAIDDNANDKDKRYKKISKDYKIFAPKNNTFLNINFILYNVVIFTLLFIVTNTSKYWEKKGFGNEYNKYLLMTLFLVKVGAQSIFRFNKYVTEDLLLSIRVIELCCSTILFGGTLLLLTNGGDSGGTLWLDFKHLFINGEKGIGFTRLILFLYTLFIIYNNATINETNNTFKYSIEKQEWFNEPITSILYGTVLLFPAVIVVLQYVLPSYNIGNILFPEESGNMLMGIFFIVGIGIFVLAIIITKEHRENAGNGFIKEGTPTVLPVILNILMIVSGIIIAVSTRDASGDQNGGGKNTNLYKIVGGILATGIVIYLYKNYEDNKLNKINKKKKIKGGVTASDIKESASIDIATKDVFEIKPADQANSNILIIVIGIILLIILWSSGILDGDDLKDYISNQLLSQKNLYNLRLLFFPFTILIFISLLFGTPFLETVLKGFVEKQSIGNFYDDKEKNETIKTNIEKQQDIDKNANQPDKKLFRGIKYSAIAFIILYYIFLLASEKLEFSFSIIVNLVIIGIFVYLLINASYILLKIYLNENINKIGEKIDAIQKMKSQIQFKQGKIDPKLDNVVEIDDDKIKRDYEVFINKLYDDIKNLLQINNIYLTTAIENYIKVKLIKHKPIEEQFKLSHTELQKTLSVTPAKKIINGGTVVPIAETDISKKLNGKWYNNANDNNVLIYVYKTVGIIIYLNKNDYINMKLTEIQNEGTQYKFVNEGKLLLTYDNEKVIIDSINYAKLSNDFSTENIIRKTLTENDVFKNINYMITIDKDAKYIGKYNLVDNITKYNHYSKSGNVLKTDLENIIINKILLIKAIKEKQYMSANELNKQVNKLEKKFKKKEEFNKYDTDKSGTIDANEIQSYVNKNHKLSGAGNVKIKSAIFDGSDVIITFDKKLKYGTNVNYMRNFITTRNVLLTVDSQDYYIDVQKRISDTSKIVTEGPMYQLTLCDPDNPDAGCHDVNAAGKSILDFSTVLLSDDSEDFIKFKKIHNNKGRIIQAKKVDTNYQYYTSDDINWNFGNSITFISNADTTNDKFTPPEPEPPSSAPHSYFIMDGNIIYEENMIKIPIYNYDLIKEINSTNNIKIKVTDDFALKFNNKDDKEIIRTLKKSIINVYKQISNFEEFDASIFGT